jgi:hypothetical protein
VCYWKSSSDRHFITVSTPCYSETHSGKFTIYLPLVFVSRFNNMDAMGPYPHGKTQWPRPATNERLSIIGGCSAPLHPTHHLIERWAELRALQGTCDVLEMSSPCRLLGSVVGSVAWPWPIRSMCPLNGLNASGGLRGSCFHCIPYPHISHFVSIIFIYLSRTRWLLFFLYVCTSSQSKSFLQ